MTWFRIDDGLADHPKWLALSAESKAAWVEMGCYCSRHLTDGIVAPGIVARYRPRVLAELERSGMAHPNGDGLLLHDFLDYNPSRAEVEERRRQKVEAGRRGGLARHRERLWKE